MIQQERTDRRRHIVFVTRHTEYHCRDAECVGVRDRKTGSWRRFHAALRSQLIGATEGDSFLRIPKVGTRLLFNGNHLLKTSRLECTMRPLREHVTSYCSQYKSGWIDAAN